MSVIIEDRNSITEVRRELYKSFLSSVKYQDGRKWEYIKKHQFAVNRIMMVAMVGGFAFGTACAVAWVFGKTAKEMDREVPIVFQLVIVTAIGSLIGLSVGAGIVYKIYRSWLKSENERLLKEKITEFVNMDPVLKDFNCAITRDIALNPVRTPYTPNLYEKKALSKWIKEKGSDPMTRQSLKRADLIPAMDVLTEASKEIHRILEEDLDPDNLDPAFIKELSSLKQTLEKNLLILQRPEPKDRTVISESTHEVIKFEGYNTF